MYYFIIYIYLWSCIINMSWLFLIKPDVEWLQWKLARNSTPVPIHLPPQPLPFPVPGAFPSLALLEPTVRFTDSECSWPSFGQRKCRFYESRGEEMEKKSLRNMYEPYIMNHILTWGTRWFHMISQERLLGLTEKGQRADAMDIFHRSREQSHQHMIHLLMSD